MNPEYPIYIISKGRWDRRLTVNALTKLNVQFKIIVEQQEYDKYASVINPEKILILPQKYQDEYDTADNLGLTKSKGPGSARNFAWDHSIDNGFSYHWVMDDNIAAFGRINRNLYVQVTSGTIFRCAEDFVNRYENIAIAGLNYDFFAKTRTKIPPYVLNTRIYSCLLIRNDIPYRWRGRYNEDTDLSLRVLKDGWCTVQFNAFIQEKATTQTIKGGNTAEFYSVEGTYPKSKMIADLHPDIAKIVFKFKRWHHQVNYRIFKRNRLIRKSNIVIPDGVNNFGMILKKIK